MTVKALLFLLTLSATCVAPFSTLSSTKSRSSSLTIGSTTSSNSDAATPIGSVNCHVHLMTAKDVPPGWPNKWLKSFGTNRFTRWFARRILPWFDPFRDDDLFHRYANFLRHSTMEGCQEENYDHLVQCYGPDMNFVVLPMDLRSFDPNHPPEHTLIEQHLELADVARKHVGKVIPFIHIDPRLSAQDENGLLRSPVSFIQHLHQDGLHGVKFRGIKLYPPFGYDPNDPQHLWPIWEYANNNRMPVTSHCMSSTLTWNRNEKNGYGIKDKKTLRSYTAPSAYVNVLQKYPNMRLNLAHFGGNKEWNIYLHKNHRKIANIEKHPVSYFEDKDGSFQKQDWVTQILEMLVSDCFPNLYTDLSYTFFDRKMYNKHLKPVLESHENIRNRVLFGSDYYMSVQVNPQEDEFAKTIQDNIGPDFFRQIAVNNANEYLGI